MLKWKTFGFLALFLMVCFHITGTIAVANADDTAILKKLEKLILQQQAQIEAQAKAIDALQKEINSIQAGSAKSGEPIETAKPEGLVQSKGDKTRVSLYGQVNAGVLVSDDGDDTSTYLVDNDNSSTRIGITGSAKTSETLDVGTKIEVQFESNSSSSVNQNDKREVGDNHFTKRFLELYLNTNKYGKLTVGYGSTASDGTSESDFSGTSVVGYSGVADMAGGQYFYNNNTQDLDTLTQIKNVFTNMDGLGRDDRIRYDTPTFSGLSAAASYIADGGGDIALRYGASYDRFKVAAAISYADPASTSDKTDYQISSSLAALHKESGISLSLSGGMREYKADGDGDGMFFYTKLGYQKDFFSIGKTAFSIDYGIFKDIAADNDEATTFGAQFVQNMDDWRTEYYFGFRHHSLDRDNTDYEDINAVLSGFRIKF